MSLSVYIRNFKKINIKLSMYVRLKFRDKIKLSTVHRQTDEILEIKENFKWILDGRPLIPGEILEVHLIGRTRHRNDMVVGVYRLDLQELVSERFLAVADGLVKDQTTKSATIYVDMQIFHTPADNPPGLVKRTSPVVPDKPRELSDTQPSNLLASSSHQPNSLLNMAREKVYKIQQFFTSFHTRQSLTSPFAASQKVSISPVLSTYTYPKSQQVITPPLSPTSRHASPSNRRSQLSPTSSKSSDKMKPLLNKSPTVQKTTLSPTLQQASTSLPPGSSQQGLTRTYAFHQALISMYGAKKDRDQLSSGHKSSSSQSSQQGSLQSSPQNSDQSSTAQLDVDDPDFLVQVEENITNLENYSIKKEEKVLDIDCEDDNKKSRGAKLKQMGRRILRQWSFGESAAGRAVKCDPTSELKPKNIRKKSTTFRNLLRLRKSKDHVKNDMEMGFLDIAAGTSAPDIPSSQTSPEAPEKPLKIRRNTRTIMEPREPISQMPAAYKISVTIIEARQLAGLNINSLVAVEVGDMKKYPDLQGEHQLPLLQRGEIHYYPRRQELVCSFLH